MRLHVFQKTHGHARPAGQVAAPLGTVASISTNPVRAPPVTPLYSAAVVLRSTEGLTHGCSQVFFRRARDPLPVTSENVVLLLLLK